MRNQHHCAAKRADALAQLVYAFLIQIAGRFVEQKHRRILGKRTGQPAARLFPTAQPIARGSDGAELARLSRGKFIRRVARLFHERYGRHAPHCAGIGRQSAGENAQKCGFARAVRADQPHALAIVQRKSFDGQHRLRAKAHLYIHRF